MAAWPLIDISGRKIGYARVSTKDQKLRMQRDALVGVGCSPIFEDHGVSGAKTDRPGLSKLLETAESGDAVVVFKLDRLGRSVLGLADLLAEFRRRGIHFCSLGEGINTATPGGKLIYHIFAAIAEFQREIIVENTVAGLDAARRRGARLGRPPLLDEADVQRGHALIMQTGLSVAAAARTLGVDRNTLARALARTDILCDLEQ